MKQILKIEIYRAFRTKGMLFSFIGGCVLSVLHIIQYQIPAHQTLLQRAFEDAPIWTPPNVAGTWMAGNGYNLEGFAYFLVVPILAMLPYGVSYFSDQEQGVLKNIYMRVKRREYLKAKYIATFLSGGFAVTIPLFINVLCCMCLVPNLLPSTILPQNGICAVHVWNEIYFSHPLLYIAIFLLIDFCFGGIFACVTLAASFLSDYKMVVAICPFFLQLLLHVVCTLLNIWEYSSVYVMQAGYGIKQIWVLIAYLAIGFFGTFFIFMYKGERADAF